MSARPSPTVPLEPRRFRLEPLRYQLTEGLWVLPTAATVLAVLLAWGMVAFDQSRGQIAQTRWAFSGGPVNAQQVLSTIATAVLGFTGLVFSIMIVALQLASSQFSPRVMRTFLRDRGTQVVLAIFVGTFVYTLVVLQAVRAGVGGPLDSTRFVPGDAVTVAIGFVLVTVLAFVYIVQHMARSIRVVAIIELVTRETRETIEDNLAAAVTPEQVASLETSRGSDLRARALEECAGRDSVVYGAPRAGVLTDFDEAGLTRLASRHGVVIEILHAVGDFVPRGGPLIRVHGEAEPTVANALRRHIRIAAERTMDQDVAFGFRQLVDIAERALSPAVNDPTTAVQAIDRIHDLLRELGARPFPSGVVRDRHGELRLVIPRESWHEMVALAFTEIRSYGETSIQVARRLRAAFDDLIGYVSPARQEAVEEMLGELRHGIERGFDDPGDRQRARIPDAGGLGSDDAEAAAETDPEVETAES